MLIEKYNLTATEAAAALGCSTQTMYKLLGKGTLHGYKASGHKAWRIPSAEVETFPLRITMEIAKNDGKSPNNAQIVAKKATQHSNKI